MSEQLTKFCAKVAALFITRSSSLVDTKKAFNNLPKPKASVPSSLGMGPLRETRSGVNRNDGFEI